MKKATISAMALALCAGVATASTETVPVFETVTFTNVASVNELGDSLNTVLTRNLIGGYTATGIRVTGNLTEVDVGTFGSEADILLTTFSAGTFDLDPSSAGNYSGSVAVGPTVQAFPGFDPIGPATFEFYESFDDGAGADQIWDDITIEFVGDRIVTNGEFDLGNLPTDGTMITQSGSMVRDGLDFYDFSFDGVGDPGSFLNIQTLFDTGTSMDTEIALYDSLGNLVATDDDGQVTSLGGVYSMLSFGADDPIPAPILPADTFAAEDGATLAAGDYTIVVGGFNTVFGSTIGDITPGRSAGDYDLKVTYAIPAPGSLALVGMAGLIGTRRRR